MNRLTHLLLTLLLGITLQSAAQQRLPDFTIADTGAHYHSIHPQTIKKQLLLIYFQPDCEECRAFTKQLIAHRQVLTKYKLIMVTNASLPALKRFLTEFGPGLPKETLIGTEGWTNTILRSQGIQRFPYAAIYTKGKFLEGFTADHSF